MLRLFFTIKLACIFLLIEVLLTLTLGTSCWDCRGAESEEDCHSNGTAVACNLTSGNICEQRLVHDTGARYGILITKLCRTVAKKCRDTSRLNPPGCSLGNINARTSSCTFCCSTDLCNKELPSQFENATISQATPTSINTPATISKATANIFPTSAVVTTTALIKSTLTTKSVATPIATSKTTSVMATTQVSSSEANPALQTSSTVPPAASVTTRTQNVASTTTVKVSRTPATTLTATASTKLSTAKAAGTSSLNVASVSASISPSTADASSEPVSSKQTQVASSPALWGGIVAALAGLSGSAVLAYKIRKKLQLARVRAAGQENVNVEARRASATSQDASKHEDDKEKAQERNLSSNENDLPENLSTAPPPQLEVSAASG